MFEVEAEVGSSAHEDTVDVAEFLGRGDGDHERSPFLWKSLLRVLGAL